MVGCDGDSDSSPAAVDDSQSPPAAVRTFHVAFLDMDGNETSRGTLGLLLEDGDDEQMMLVNGHPFKALFDNASFWVDLRPDMADANPILSGHRRGDALVGLQEFASISGASRTGTFVAVEASAQSGKWSVERYMLEALDPDQRVMFDAMLLILRNPAGQIVNGCVDTAGSLSLPGPPASGVNLRVTTSNETFNVPDMHHDDPRLMKGRIDMTVHFDEGDAMTATWVKMDDDAPAVRGTFRQTAVHRQMISLPEAASAVNP